MSLPYNREFTLFTYNITLTSKLNISILPPHTFYISHTEKIAYDFEFVRGRTIIRQKRNLPNMNKTLSAFFDVQGWSDFVRGKGRLTQSTKTLLNANI